MDIELNGVTYSYMMVGEGPALVLLHGFTGCKENWKLLYGELADRYTVIAVDLIGHGDSDSPIESERYSIEKVCQDLHVLLDQLQMEEAHFLGYSMGGRVALGFSIMFPSRVKSLILESSSPGLRSAEAKHERIVADEKLACDILHNGLEAFIDRWEVIPLFQSQKRLPHAVQNRIREQRHSNVELGLAGSLRGMGTGRQPSFWNELSTIQLPVLLICGSIDEKFCTIAEEMDKYIPHSTKYQVFNAGHAIHVEQPELFGKIVREFLSKCN